MFCTNCGKEVPDGSKVCPSCGASIANDAAEETKNDATATGTADDAVQQEPKATDDSAPQAQNPDPGQTSGAPNGQPAPNQQAPNQQMPNMQMNVKRGNGFGTVSLVMGILSIAFCWILGGWYFGLIGIIFGIIGLLKKSLPHGKAITGLILSGIAFLLTIIFFFAGVGVLSSANNKTDDVVPDDEYSWSVDDDMTDETSAPIVATETAVATEAHYTISNTYFDVYTDALGSVSYYAVIEIENDGNTGLYLGSSSFDIEDESGHLITTDDIISSCPGVIEPGEKGYYYNSYGTTIPEGDPNVSYQLVPNLDIQEATGTAEYLDVSDTDMKTDEYGSINVTGRVTNTSDSDISYLYVNVVFYDSTGEAILVAGTSVTDLPSGEEQSFEVSTLLSSGNVSMDDVASYAIVAQETYYQF